MRDESLSKYVYYYGCCKLSLRKLNNRMERSEQKMNFILFFFGYVLCIILCTESSTAFQKVYKRNSSFFLLHCFLYDVPSPRNENGILEKIIFI